MSTRSTTHFVYGDSEPEAIIYRHTDGYPEGHGVDLTTRFFADVEAQTQDTRYGDPSYLAAKLVVWLANEFATSLTLHDDGTHEWGKSEMLDFISVGVMREDPGDIEYRYVVDCGAIDGSKSVPRPTVKCFERGGKNWDDWFEVTIPGATDAD